MQRLFELDPGKLDFVSITPWQPRLLIATVAVPPQRRLQWEASLLHERNHLLRIPRLLRNSSSGESKQYPAKKRSHSCREKTPNSYEEKSGQNENHYGYERTGKKKK